MSRINTSCSRHAQRCESVHVVAWNHNSSECHVEEFHIIPYIPYGLYRKPKFSSTLSDKRASRQPMLLQTCSIDDIAA